MENNKIDKYDSKSEQLYANGDYAVHRCTLRDPMLQTEILAYGVYNVVTGIREAEARRLVSALNLCDSIAQDMFERMSPQQDMFEDNSKWTAKLQ